ncbi:MAG: galactokinase [Eubacteriales bacterium]|nr:galactokinase [Eubacteriales bacterium]
MLTNQELQTIQTCFAEKFGGDDGRLFFAPSRINIIGEHIDYNGGRVLPCAIEIGTYACVRQRADRKIRLFSMNLDQEEPLVLDLDNDGYDEERGWLNYPMGMLKYLKEQGFRTGGFEGVVFGNIPNGAGLSSSASLELLVGQICSTFFNNGEIPMLDLVKTGKRVENDYFGLMTGIMDQFAIGMGKADHCILLNTASLQYDYIPLELGEYCFVIMSTNYRRELKDSKYNERRAECESGLSDLQAAGFKLKNLCEMDSSGWKQAEASISAPNVRKRIEHVVTENERVDRAVAAMRAMDMVTLGELLCASHASLKDLYEVTGPHLDAIVEGAMQAGAIGARMTGAGFGGCAIALVKKEQTEDFIEKTGRYYREQTGLTGSFFISGVDNGPREL